MGCFVAVDGPQEVRPCIVAIDRLRGIAPPLNAALVTIDFIGKPRAVTEAELFQLTVVEATHLIRGVGGRIARSEEHTSELQSLMRISYAVFCLKNKTSTGRHTQATQST